MAEISTQEQIVREAPEIEAQKLALLQSAKAQVDATNFAAQQGNFLTPNYQIAGMTQNQMDAIRGGEAGIGAYQPYLVCTGHGPAGHQLLVQLGCNAAKADTGRVGCSASKPVAKKYAAISAVGLLV
jgi:hypothetical protein